MAAQRTRSRPPIAPSSGFAALPSLAMAVGVAALACFVAAGSVSAQAGGVAPGDSIRFQASRVMEWQAADGGSSRSTVEWSTVEGTLIALGRDSITIAASGAERTYALEVVEDVRAWTTYDDPMGRGFRRGAIIGGVFGGLGGLALGLCNPAIFGDEGCMGPDDAETVVYPTVAGALGGAVVFGVLGALLASREGWERVEVTSAAFAPGEGGLLSFRVPVGF